MSSKVKHVRNGHRSAVSRLLNKFEEIKGDEESFDEIARMAAALEKKVSTLTELNDKILEDLPDDEIKTEIADTDEYMFDLESKIHQIQKLVNSKRSMLSTMRSSVASNVFSNPTPSGINNTQHSVQESGPRQTHDVPPPPLIEIPRVLPTESHGSQSQGLQQTESNFSTSSQFQRLPKLTLPSFSGNLLEWQPFWDSFESSVHLNQGLSEIQKFNYLQAQVEGEEARTISGFAMTNSNYSSVISLLRERFGQQHKIVQAHMHAMVNLPAPSNNYPSLRSFYDQLESSIRSLESLGETQEKYGSLLVPIVLAKLPAEIRKHLARENGSDKWILAELRQALHKELTVLEAGNVSQISDVPTATASFFTGGAKRRVPATQRKPYDAPLGARPILCVFCGDHHSSANCSKVVSRQDRVAVVKRKKLCFNCLGQHLVSACRSNNRCRQCKRKHHTSICDQSGVATSSSGISDQETTVPRSVPQPNAAAALHSTIQNQTNVLLKTAVAEVTSRSLTTTANILFDEGAQRSFITQQLADELELPRNGNDLINLATFGSDARNTQSFETTTVHVFADHGQSIPINVLVVPSIAVPLKTYQREAANLPYLRGLKLAHPVTEDEVFNISVLIGADFYWSFVQDKVVRGNGPTAVKSKLGYLLSGPLPVRSSDDTTVNHMMNLTVSPPAVHDIERFWKLESLGITDDNNTAASDHLKNYQETCIAFEDGRYLAKLPWKSDHPPLPTNYGLAKKRTESTIHRLSQDPHIFSKYSQIMEDQEKRGFIERVPDTEKSSEGVHYIPHHGVKKESSTTPVRIVYDCSSRQSPLVPSLNDCLESAPPDLNDVSSILLRFRMNKFAISTDIEKAFLNVSLDEKDRDFTRFFWISDPSEPKSPLTTFRFRSVLFGATCSPFILNATLLKHLERHNDNWVSEILKRDLYVDNIITSLSNETDVLRFFQDTRCLMADAGFNLRSWNSNSAQLRSLATDQDALDSDKLTKVLGLRWDAVRDEMSFQHSPIPTCNSITKRQILQYTARVNDPLGLLSPVTIKAKIFLQNLWKGKFTWDEMLPDDVNQRWHDIASDLNLVSDTRFPRYCFETSNKNNAEKTSLHVFVDASMMSYGAVAYLTRGATTTFVMAKTRVAPLKTLTLPRLELMAAVIGARLARHIQRSIDVSEIYMWSDSMIVLCWLRSTKPLQQFVHNRVTEIRDLTSVRNWNYCPTQDNPADLLTRGITAARYRDNRLWLKGPEWLFDKQRWPDQNNANALITVLSAVTKDPDTDQPLMNEEDCGIHRVINIEKFSTYQKLLRVTAFVMRFVRNCRETRRNMRDTGSVTVNQLRSAEIVWLQSCQSRNYHDEIATVKAQKKGPSIVKQLGLFVDSDGLLRCNGRIHNSSLDEHAKFPYLLPPKNYLTNLIIRQAHERQLHAGTEATVTFLRQKFWIPSARQCVRSVLRKCVTCRKTQGKPYEAPDPPPLPKIRVNDEPPFAVTGVDYTGALTVRAKGGSTCKAYICLFTCASTRAVHLELVPDLSMEAFLQAFRRFCSRKSVPRTMFSDNATTFMAASNHLKRLCGSSSVQDVLAQKGTEWRFIPKRAPWYGGWWERLIGITKSTLKKVLGRACISYEALQTVLTEVEAVINDRPLTYVTSDSNDPEPLTPAQLLYGRRLTTLPVEGSDDIINNAEVAMTHSNLVKRARDQKRLIEQFHVRWRREYLTGLREQRRETGRNLQTISIGDVVQIHDDGPRIGWKLAVVEDVVRGNDGLVRAAKLRTSTGVTNRPIVRLYPLEVTSRDICDQ